MAQTINTNMPSLNAQRNLNASQGSLATSMQRLSSGLRVNSAKDDAAGLAIAERMNTQIRGMNVAIRNANDGISAAQTAEAGLATVSGHLQRMREIAVQSASGQFDSSNRGALDKEYQQLASEITRALDATNFNGTKLLDGNFSTTDLSTGQRKRLALVNAWLEERPVLVFDEWAADQDPTFRRIFYTELLPELRAQGKTLIVISHDDRYFNVADRLLLTKTDLVSEAEKAALIARLVDINGRAAIYETLQGQGVDLAALLDVNSFSLESVLEREPDFLASGHHHHHNNAISSFAFTTHGEFDPARLDEGLKRLAAVVRQAQHAQAA